MDTSTFPEIPNRSLVKSCFICSKNCVSEEIVDSLLDFQGIPNTVADKLNILKVLCQLVRVKWESIEPLVKHNFIFPFCLACLKSTTEIICLREQLFTIESDIRNRINHIQTTVAKAMEDENFESEDWKYFMDQGEFDVKTEHAGSYADCKGAFQKQVMNEYCSKQLLEIKIQDRLKNGIDAVVELNPSLIQLHLQKNTFQILDRQNSSVFPPNSIPDSCGDETITGGCSSTERTSTELQDESGTQNRSESNCQLEPQFVLNLVEKDDEVSDDSDYGSPSKKIKVGPEKSNEPISNPLTCVDEYNPVEKESDADSDWSGVSLNSEDTDCCSESENSEDDKPPILFPNTESQLTIPSNKEPSNSLPKLHPLDRKKYNVPHEPFPKISKLKNRKSKSTQRFKTPKNTKKSSRDPKNRKVEHSPQGHKSSTICLTQHARTFQGKDGTEWSTEPDQQNCIKKSQDYTRGGLVGAVRNPNLSPVELFKFMFCTNMADTIVEFTNAYAEAFRTNRTGTPNSKIPPWKPMTQDELYAYIGILIYLGLEKKRNVNLDEAWNSDPKYVTHCIIATMSRNRFTEISKFLRFDDKVARDGTVGKDGPQAQAEVEDQQQSKLGYISAVFDPFVKNIESHFRPYDNLVVDEMLVRYKGKVRFRVYMKSKPGKYGMKIWVLCDATTGYILRLCIYEGKVGQKIETQLGKKVVLGLVENYFESGRTVTTDNFFTSKSLGSELLKRNIKLLGTLNKNKMDVIPEFTDGREREVESSIFAFQNPFTMVSYVQRINKPVLLLSTAHSTAEINPQVKNKPKMILDYNASKGGVDTADKMIGTYSCQRATQRWPVKLFQAMCDIGALNAYIIWKLHRSNESDKDLYGLRRKFLRSLSEGLMDPIIKIRALNPQASALHLATRTAIAIMGYTIPTVAVEHDNSRVTRGRCESCPGSARQRVQSKKRCAGCDKFICARHWTRVIHCNNCPFILDKGEKLVKLRRIQPQILFGIQSVPNMCTI